MSRRKQLKPRALKREEGEEEDAQEEEDQTCARSPATADPDQPQAMAASGESGEKDPPLGEHSPVSLTEDRTHPRSTTDDVDKGDCSDDDQSIASVDSDVSVGACSSLWEGGSEEGRGSLTATPTSSEEGRDNVSGTPTSLEEGRDYVSGTPTSEADIEASSTVGVTEATPYPCSFCDFAFPRLSYLKRHEQTHSDRLPFRCAFCGRHFKHKRSRDRHVKLHTGDKKYKCAHCDAAFSRSDHLKIHLKTHDTQKPYRCSVCTRGYSTAAALTAHMQNHKSRRSTTPLDRLLKDVGGPGIGCDPALISRLIQDSTESGGSNSQEKESNKATTEPSEPPSTNPPSSESPSSVPHSPTGGLRCPLCQVQCKGHAHLQHHLAENHADSAHQDRPPSATNPSTSSSAEVTPADRPPSESNHSGASSYGGVPGRGLEISPTASNSPASRPASVVTSPRSGNLPPGATSPSNPFLALVGGKLTCPFCPNVEGFSSFESFHLHLQSVHGSVIGNELLGGSIPHALSSYRAGGIFSPLFPALGAAGSSRQVTCELCGARVGGVTALQRHVITAHSFTDLLARAAEGVFCAQCLLPFSNPGALTEHIKLVHTAPVGPALSLFSGALAKRSASPPREHPTDLSKKPRRGESPKSELPSSTFLCGQCDAPFPDFESFRAHLKTHLEEGVEGPPAGGHSLTCPECQARLRSESALESHLAGHLEATLTEYGCHACRKTFTKPDELQKHLLDMHAHHLYRCALCRQVFDSKVSIQVHFAVRHSDEAKVHKCLKCGLKCHSRAEFEGHIRESHLGPQGGREPMGKHNGLIAPPSDPLALSPPNKIGGGGFRCLLCPASLSTEVEMGVHLATHERRFRCSLCDDAFHVEFLLDRHVETAHANELNGATHHSDTHHREASLLKGAAPGDGSLCMPTTDLRCGVCDALCASEAALALHRKAAHGVKGTVTSSKGVTASLSLFCAYCNEVCKSRPDLEAHMKAAHVGSTGGRHKCNICDEVFPSASSLATHKLAHVKVLSGGSSPCVVCREPLVSSEQVRSHQREHHPRALPQPCVVCRQTLIADVELRVHAHFHAHGGSVAAFDGEKEKLTNDGVGPGAHETEEESHEDRREETERRTYQCIKCQESFASESAVEAHVAAHLEREGSAAHPCHLCRAQMDTPLRLQRHLIEHTFEGCGSFTCYLCASVFTTAARLQAHMGGHGLGARPYDCHHCRQRFFFRAELENHLAGGHPKDVLDGCHECRAALPSRWLRPPLGSQDTNDGSHSLQHQLHTTSNARGEAMPTHRFNNVTNEPVTPEGESNPSSGGCQTCGRRCRNSASLHLHSLTHEGGKPYLCGECGTAFTRRCEAAKHPSAAPHGDPPSPCTICNVEFSSRADAQAHVRASHGGPNTEVVRPESRCSSCDGEMDSSDSSHALL